MSNLLRTLALVALLSIAMPANAGHDDDVRVVVPLRDSDGAVTGYLVVGEHVVHAGDMIGLGGEYVEIWSETNGQAGLQPHGDDRDRLDSWCYFHHGAGPSCGGEPLGALP